MNNQLDLAAKYGCEPLPTVKAGVIRSEIAQSKSGDIQANFSVEREAILAWVSLRA